MKKTNVIIVIAAVILVVVLYLFVDTIIDMLSGFGVV
jgi:hypothetical protein